MNLTLWFFEYSDGSRGNWRRSWHAAPDEAEAERQRLIGEGYDEDDEGDLGCVGSCVISQAVAMTPEGLLEFARTFAMEAGA